MTPTAETFPIVVEIVILLAALPLFVCAVAALLDRADRHFARVRARRAAALARSRTAPGSGPAPRGHTRRAGPTSEHLRGGHWR